MLIIMEILIKTLIKKDLCPLSKIPLWDFLFLLLDLTQQPSHSGQNSKGISED